MRNDLPYNVMRYKSFEVAPREPISASIINALSTASITGFTAQAIAFLATTAITSLAVSLLSPKPKSNQGQIINSREATASQEYVYGQVRKGGTVVFMESSGDNNKYLHMVIALAGHAVEEIGDIYVNEEVVTLTDTDKVSYTVEVTKEVANYSDTAEYTSNVYLTGVPDTHPSYAVDDSLTESQYDALEAAAETVTGQIQSGTFISAVIKSVNSDNGFVEGDRWRGKIKITKLDGTQTTSPSELVAATSADTNFVGYGIAALYVRLEYDTEVFQSGIPVISAVVKGKKVYDPRPESGQDESNPTTWTWTDNAALCIRDYITSNLGLADSNVNDDYFSAAANDCDDEINLNTDPVTTEKRYRINGVVVAENNTGQILQDMVRTCNGTLYISGGEWRLRVGVYEAPVKEFTLDDFRSSIDLQTKFSRRDNFNKVTGKFINGGVYDETTNPEAGDWIEAEYPTISSDTFLAEDGGVENVLDLPLSMVTSSSQAQRVAKQTLFRSREQMTLTADFGLEALEVEVGDIVSLTIDKYGWSQKEFEVVNWSLVVGETGGIRITMVLRETSEAAFAWDAEEETIINNDSTLPRALIAPIISTLVPTQVNTEVQEDGAFVGSVELVWTPEDAAYVDHYEVFWRKNNDQWSSTTTSDQSITLTPLIAGQTYTFKVRAVVGSTKGPTTSVSLAVSGDTTYPALATGVSASGGYGNIVLNWTNPTDADFKFVRIWVNGVNDNDTSTLLAEVGGSTYVHAGLDTGVTKYYWLSSVDYSGNDTANDPINQRFTTGVTATTTSATTEDLSVSGDAVIQGDLTVNGTTTTLNVTELEIEDKNITVASGATTNTEAHGSGINVGTIGAAIQYNGTYDRWDMNRGLGVSGVFYLVPMTQPSSPYVGLTYMDSSDNIIYTWDGSNWRPHYGNYLKLE